MPGRALPVEHLFTLTATLAPAVSIAGPSGTRVIVGVTGGSFEGAKLRGTVSGVAGGDWLLVRPDGSMQLDVRITLNTDDGASIYMSYKGIRTVTDGVPAIRSAPLFETGDERYAWLNNVQGVATGTSAAGSVTYEVYALTT
jgi:hypothetical protein